MEDVAIKIENLSKDFILPHEKYSSIKSIFVNFYKRKRTYELQHALKSVSFEVKKGEFFGIVGRNGSGKSTLLKLMAGIYTPTSGSVKVNGSLTPFIELGVGFNAELSGRENVFLNGALLGLSRKQMNTMYADIVEFAELEKFMDQKLKNYSSGMQVRLAFSIAIRAKGDILLLDEVLAVGDSAFQRKCLDYFNTIRNSDKTIVLVTHSMSTIEEYCDRALLIEEGTINKIGSPQEISYLYTRHNDETYIKGDLKKLKNETEKLLHERGIQVELLSSENKKTDLYSYGDSITIKVKWQNPRVKNVGLALYSKSGKYIFGTNTFIDKAILKKNEASCSIKLSIVDDSYFFKIGLFGENDKERIDFVDEGPPFVISSKEPKKWGGLIELDHSWL